MYRATPFVHRGTTLADRSLATGIPVMGDVEKNPVAGLRFEWDENKRRSNIIKHKIDFLDVVAVFSDPKACVVASSQSRNEQRYLIVGRIKAKAITVIFTRRGVSVRLISARAARRNERQKYGSEE